MKLKNSTIIGTIITTIFTILSCENSSGNQPFEPLQRPVATIVATPVEGFAPMTVEFDASSSTAADGIITDYTWQISDGSEERHIANFRYIFLKPGTYTVRLSVCDCQQQTDTINITISVKEKEDSDPDPYHDKLP